MSNPEYSIANITQTELGQIVKRVNPKREFGAARMCRLIAANGSVISAELRKESGVENIRDIAAKCINPRIADMGLFIGCEKKPREASNSMRWSFYRIEGCGDAAK